jgi:general secretion pathway protein K
MGAKEYIRRDPGIALILTLWVITILMVTATYFAYGQRWDTRVASYHKESTFSYYLAKGIVAKTRVLLASDQNVPDGQQLEFTDGVLEIPEEEFAGGSMRAVVRDLEGKLNINKAPYQMIRSLLINLGCEYEEAETIADCILDWRDVNSEPRANGAEDDYYLSLPEPYPCKDGSFDFTEELLLVKGMTNEIFYGDSLLAVMRGEEFSGSAVYLGLKNYITVYGRGRINVNSADPLVLEAIPGFDDEIVRSIVQKREQQDGGFENVSEVISLISQSGEESARSYRSQLSVHSYYYAIEGEGRLNDSVSRLQAIIYRYGRNSRILPRIVAWRELT